MQSCSLGAEFHDFISQSHISFCRQCETQSDTLFETHCQNSLDILRDIDDDDEQSLFECGARHDVLPTLSETRWLSQVDSITALLANYCEVHDALIKVRDQSNGQSAHDAQSIDCNDAVSIHHVSSTLPVCARFYSVAVCFASICDVRPLGSLAAYAYAQNITGVLQSVCNSNNDVDKFDKLY